MGMAPCHQPHSRPEAWGRKELLSLPAGLGTKSVNISFLSLLSVRQPAHTMPAGAQNEWSLTGQEGC